MAFVDSGASGDGVAVGVAIGSDPLPDGSAFGAFDAVGGMSAAADAAASFLLAVDFGDGASAATFGLGAFSGASVTGWATVGPKTCRCAGFG
ncbi:MAG: hypothetical protein MJE12_19835 [Alphaproteobacteria bacterium]|nr:hypothetical protein [Alphaproteobacteria bacterium]